MAIEKYTVEQVINAIQGSGCIKASIAARLGCHRHTIDNYIERYTVVQIAFEKERQAFEELAREIKPIRFGLENGQLRNMISPRMTYIYGLVDPRDGEIYYIGKSDDPKRRLVEHIGDVHNKRKRQWIEELDVSGLRPIVIVLEKVKSGLCYDKEAAWIHQGLECGWPLLNDKIPALGAGLKRNQMFDVSHFRHIPGN